MSSVRLARFMIAVVIAAPGAGALAQAGEQAGPEAADLADVWVGLQGDSLWRLRLDQDGTGLAARVPAVRDRPSALYAIDRWALQDSLIQMTLRPLGGPGKRADVEVSLAGVATASRLRLRLDPGLHRILPRSFDLRREREVEALHASAKAAMRQHRGPGAPQGKAGPPRPEGE